MQIQTERQNSLRAAIDDIDKWVLTFFCHEYKMSFFSVERQLSLQVNKPIDCIVDDTDAQTWWTHERVS